MLYKDYQIKLWKTEWIGKRIEGEWYCLDGFTYLEIDEWAKRYKYIALVAEIDPLRSQEVWGGSTPKIALDLAKFSIDLQLAQCRRWTFAERKERWKTHRLKLHSSKPL